MFVDIDFDQVYDDEFYSWTSESDTFGWWLRTEGANGIAYVDPWDKTICYDGSGGDDDDCWGVRPALWLNLG